MQLWILEYMLAYTGLFIAVLFTLVYIRNLSGVHRSEVPRSDGWEPKVSIIIPAYNEEEYIAGCIKSVLALDYPREKLEILVVDDGSKDRTFEIAKRISAENPCVHAITKKNSGKADSLNFAITRVSGEIVACLDADSYVSPYTLRRMLGLFDSAEIGAVASAVKVRDSKNIVEEVQRIEYLFALFSRKIMKMLNSVTVTPGPFSMFRREALIKVGGFDTKSLVEDQEIALRLQKNGYSINCSTDGDVYTEIPHNFFELMAQRTRWQRGGFWNAVKYLGMINPKYGDLGVIVLPFTMLGYIMLLTAILIATYKLLNIHDYGSFDFTDSILFNINLIHILSFVWLTFLFFWFFYGMKRMFANDRFSLPSVLLYLICYPIFTTIFWFSAAYTEVRSGGKFLW